MLRRDVAPKLRRISWDHGFYPWGSIELVLFLMAILFGRVIGYDWTVEACFWLGVIVAACVIIIVLLSISAMGLQRLYRIAGRRCALDL
jgi:hypothetical protein